MKGEVGEAAKPVYQTSNTIFEIHKRNSKIKRKYLWIDINRVPDIYRHHWNPQKKLKLDFRTTVLISGGQRKLWQLNILELYWKKIWVKIFGVKIFGVKIFWGEIFWGENFLGWKFFGWKFLGVKIFGVKLFWAKFF